jgi:enoyl-CoA hydratase/carnithine racemase
VTALDRLRDPETALAALRADPESAGILAGQPLLAVRVDGVGPAGPPRGTGGTGGGEATVRLGQLARTLPVISVAVADDPAAAAPGVATAGYDVLLTAAASPPAPWVGPFAPAAPARVDPAGLEGPAAALAAIEEMAHRFPLACVALVQLLRLSARMDVRDAVVAESFTYSSLQAGPEFAAWLAAHRATRASRASRASRADTGSGEEPAVLVSRDGGDLIIVLNRPRVHNAVNTAVRDGLVDAFALVDADPTITAVRLSGAGPSFSSGGDLTEFGQLSDPARAHVIRTTRSIPLAVARHADRVTAHVQGTCVGAGVEIPSFAGTVIADPDTTFQLPEVAMGLVPGAGGTAGITRRIGPERTAFLGLSGWALPAPVALAWGLVDAIAPVAPG